MWSATGGSVVAGEDSYSGALREMKEELGIDLSNENGYLFDSSLYEEDNQKYWCDTYLYFIDLDVEKLQLQKEEVKQAKYEKMEVIKQMMNDGDFFIYDYLVAQRRGCTFLSKTCRKKMSNPDEIGRIL